ncbi:MAG TPA: DsbC family protein [Deltaproteobacteria bacterium]|nr:DsbC family protein [Deltaproteobacteria bacterium]
MKKILKTAAAALLIAAAAGPMDATAFQGQGCGADCADCHTLTPEEARKLLKTDKFNAELKEIRLSPVKGLWEVEVTRGDKSILVYIDFAKKYLVEARFTPLDELGKAPQLKRLDRSRIPMDNALIMGDREAEKKIIVFDDPDCPYCKKLHYEIKKVVKKRPDIAFYILLYPLDIHPDAYKKAKAIQCRRSVEMLEEAFEGKVLPEPDCDDKVVDENIRVGRELGIQGTPALIMPDGRLIPGYLAADVLIEVIDQEPQGEGAQGGHDAKGSSPR